MIVAEILEIQLLWNDSSTLPGRGIQAHGTPWLSYILQDSVLGNLVILGLFYHNQVGSIRYLQSSTYTQATESSGDDSMHNWALVDSCHSSHSERMPEPSIFLNLPVYTFLFWILPLILIQHFGLLYFHPPYAVTRRKLSCCYQIANKVRILDHSLHNPSDIAIQRKLCRTSLNDEAESEK